MDDNSNKQAKQLKKPELEKTVKVAKSKVPTKSSIKESDSKLETSRTTSRKTRGKRDSEEKGEVSREMSELMKRIAKEKPDTTKAQQRKSRELKSSTSSSFQIGERKAQVLSKSRSRCES